MKFEIRKGMLLNAFDNFGTYEVTDIYADGECELRVTARPIEWNEEGDDYTLLDDELTFNKNEIAEKLSYESGKAPQNIEMIYEGVKYKHHV
jgi:hypothetical protein|nr:MAG TPA: hypothetical protein [Caudoviricetes sp.]